MLKRRYPAPRGERNVCDTSSSTRRRDGSMPLKAWHLPRSSCEPQGGNANQGILTSLETKAGTLWTLKSCSSFTSAVPELTPLFFWGKVLANSWLETREADSSGAASISPHFYFCSLVFCNQIIVWMKIICLQCNYIHSTCTVPYCTGLIFLFLFLTM